MLGDRDPITRLLLEQIKSMNKHLPVKRKSLDELLREEKPLIINQDGTKHLIRREELELLASLLPSWKRKRLFLPIIIEINPDYGRGAAVIRGEVECEVVEKLLGREEDRSSRRRELVIFRAEVIELRRKLPTATQYAFFVSLSDLSKGF